MQTSLIWTGAFWRSTTERILGTVLAVILGSGALEVTTILDVQHWANVGKIALAAAGVTLLKSLIGGLSGGGPSLGGGEVIESVAVPDEQVEAKVDPTSPTGASAGAGSPLPEDTPVDVIPGTTLTYDGHGAPIEGES